MLNLRYYDGVLQSCVQGQWIDVPHVSSTPPPAEVPPPEEPPVEEPPVEEPAPAPAPDPAILTTEVDDIPGLGKGDRIELGRELDIETVGGLLTLTEAQCLDCVGQNGVDAIKAFFALHGLSFKA